MATIGMKRPVYAPITSYTSGSAITYGTGKVLAHAIAATVTQNRRDNPLYGDNEKVENDKGITDYSIDLEVDDIPTDARVALLGEKAATSSSTTSHYMLTDANPPDVGFGYITEKMRNGTKVFEGYWFHKVQFALDAEEASTKKEQIEWGTYKLSGTGFGVVLDSTNGTQFRDYMEFSSESAAITWLNGKANIT